MSQCTTRIYIFALKFHFRNKIIFCDIFPSIENKLSIQMASIFLTQAYVFLKRFRPIYMHISFNPTQKILKPENLILTIVPPPTIAPHSPIHKRSSRQSHVRLYLYPQTSQIYFGSCRISLQTDRHIRQFVAVLLVYKYSAYILHM